MSRAGTLEKVRDLKARVLDLRNADGLAGDDAAKQQILSAALALEMLGKQLARTAPAGCAFTPPPGLPSREDVREKQLPPGDRQ